MAINISMVLDGIALATTVVSLMVNGLCCLWQQQEEQKLREAIRHDVRTEYWHHRRSMELQQMRFEPEDLHNSSPKANDILHSQEERRKKLMIAKMNILQQRSFMKDDPLFISDPQCIRNSTSYSTSFHDDAGTVNDFVTVKSRDEISECLDTLRSQSTSLLDNCDTDDDGLGEIQSASSSFVNICLD